MIRVVSFLAIFLSKLWQRGGLFLVLLITSWSPFAYSHQAETKLCLTMVVKDDQAVILKCLESVKDHIDCFCIYDAGSQDGTVRIIENFMLLNAIPGAIYRHELTESNAQDKTIAVQAAQKAIESLGFPSSTYFLILNPNNVLRVSPKFKKEALVEDAYLILEKSPVLSCHLFHPHLLRASHPWKNSGIFEECWSYETFQPSAKLYTLRIETLEDQIQQGKVKQLEETLMSDPDNSHLLFLLAQYYKGSKQYDEAIEKYQIYLEKGGRPEERWFCKYMMGECFEALNQWPLALFWYLEAYQGNPNRADPLLKIAIYYRFHGENDLAYLFAKHGVRIPYATDQSLFASSPLYEYQFDEELSIVSYYTRFREEGYAAASDLTLRKYVPWYVKQQAYLNLLFYVQPLKNTRFSPISLDLPLICKESEERYHPMNPSIQKTEQGYKLICRTVNYTQRGAKEFNTIDPSGIFRTRNFLLHYDHDFNLQLQQEIIENLSRERIRAFNLEGLDDCRIFNWNLGSYFTCTTSNTNPLGNFQISLCKLGESGQEKTVAVEQLVPLKGPDPYRCEKNWLPFVKEGSLYLIYLCDPFTLFKPHLDTGECETVLRYEPSHDFSHFRGSAAPIEFDDGYLMLVHEVITRADYSRCYLHRFLYLDKNFTIARASKPFIFKNIGIEYCCSMTIDHTGKELIVPIGIEDREAALCFVDLDTVRSMLFPLPTTTQTVFQN